MFLVTGVGGELFGRPVLDGLRRLVPDVDIVGGTRDPEAVGALAGSGIALRRFDFDVPDSMMAAFDGVTAVLINGTNYGTPAERRGVQHAAAIRAAVAAGVPRIVYVSWPDPEQYPPPMMSDFAASEALLRNLSGEATILRTTYGLAQTVGRDVATAIGAGVLAAPAGRARCAPAHIDDLAEAAARVLVDDRYRGRCCTLTSADSVDWDDLAELAGTIAGRRIEYRPVGDEEFLNMVVSQGISGEMADVLLGVYRAFREGWTGTPGGDLGEILGRVPRPALDAVSAVVAR
ncbi:NAD(P)H-binding protein [Nocardia macrotermitis]|uniref:Quinone oxidoreductase 2 n=1 Tax=Nocardia macrotermitis TaxID=2585198 RepID=A0A7K0CVP9_9NOCA|nr:NAD(P)H-binding protein [Nocardia macrotermitis]MQY17463.1 Quinone oxidoreductase 2 [Nocardia macrotermitis]